MKIIICGPAMDVEMERKLLGASPAAGRFLNNMVAALETNGFSSIKAAYISYPVIDNSVYNTTNDKDGFTVFKDKYVVPSIIRFRKQLLSCVKPSDIVVFYNMTYIYFGLIKKIKKMEAFPVLMLADYTDYHEETGIVKKIISKICEKSFKQFDSVISLANYSADRFNHKAKIKIMRGGINFDYFRGITMPMIHEKYLIFMYAGLLSDVTGVDILLEAMTLLPDNNIKLVISGKGSLEKEVIEAAKRDPRIEYAGFMDVDEYYHRLGEANVFINPRNMKLAQNKNNFPSKILEYLATGRVIISTRFSGNEDFDGYVEWVNGGAFELAQKMHLVSEKYEQVYQRVYQKNRELAQIYDWRTQVKKIVDVTK